MSRKRNKKDAASWIQRKKEAVKDTLRGMFRASTFYAYRRVKGMLKNTYSLGIIEGERRQTVRYSNQIENARQDFDMALKTMRHKHTGEIADMVASEKKNIGVLLKDKREEVARLTAILEEERERFSVERKHLAESYNISKQQCDYQVDVHKKKVAELQVSTELWNSRIDEVTAMLSHIGAQEARTKVIADALLKLSALVNDGGANLKYDVRKKFLDHVNGVLKEAGKDTTESTNKVLRDAFILKRRKIAERG